MANLRYARALGVLAVFSAGFFTSCRSNTSTAAVPVVPVAIAGPATLENDLVLTAEFRPYQDVDVMAKVAGYVRSIRVDIGDHVRAGEVLATLEAPEIEDEAAKARAGMAAAQSNITTAQAELEHAQASEHIATLSFQRILDVAKRDAGLVPRQDIDVAEARSLEAKAQVARAESAVKAAREQLDEAKSESSRAAAMLAYTTISAPFSGVITRRYANTGSMIQAGISSQTQAMPVVRLAQNDLLRLILPVPVSDVAGVRDGQPVDVNVISLGRTLKGKVTRYADSVQLATRTMDTEVDVPNPDGSLVPGMYAEVHLHLAARPNVLSVPLDAVDGIGTSTEQAYVVRDGVVHLANVTTGLETATRIEILSGIKPGDKVIVGRHTGLSDSEKVAPVDATYEQSAANN
jgi:RND family efflux transporter MFP subunit